jgi:hypothetical protein
MRFRSICKVFDTYGQPVSMYHSGRKRLQSNFGGFLRISSIALVFLYAHQILLPEMDEKYYRYEQIRYRTQGNDSQSVILDFGENNLEEGSLSLKVILEQGFKS